MESEKIKEIFNKTSTSSYNWKMGEEYVTQKLMTLNDFKQALILYGVSHQRELVCEHNFGEEYTSIGGTMTLRKCEKCEEVQTCG